MGEKKSSDGENNTKPKKSSDAAGKKDEGSTTVVLKVDMHCDGCASKIIRCIRSFQGVESVKAESDAGKITITGKLDPTKVRDKLAEKMKKKVELISPQPKKENNNNKDTKPDNKSEKKAEDKKQPKEPPVTTAVLKVALHCQGCVDRIRKTVSKTKGVHEMGIDKEKETVTVKGTMDVKALVDNLMERLKRKVEVVPPKKDKSNEKEGATDKEGGNGGSKKKKKGGGGGGDDDKEEEGGSGDGGGKMEQSRMEYLAPPAFGYGYGGYNYVHGPAYMEHLHAPQMFSDENPNACSVM